ncbi:hypothetical protein R5R35_005174 [Gryllus longicercus]|uniref:C-type lectin domain-containing protein n=1 Tax=Gryllus longicercus TaxID=2509291 RepID=A0AAN9YYL0_9ORTH
MTWKEAAAACEAVRAQLVALDGGDAEARALLRAFQPHTPDRKELLWVGIRYVPKLKEFYTVRGQVISRLSWAVGQPATRSSTGENCVKLDMNGKIHSTHSCNNKRRFFCRG